MVVASEISIKVVFFSPTKGDISSLTIFRVLRFVSLLVLPMDDELELFFRFISLVVLTTEVDGGVVDFFLMSVVFPREGETDFLLRFVLLLVLSSEGEEFEFEEEFFFGVVFGVEVDFFLMSVVLPREGETDFFLMMVLLIDVEAEFFFVVIFRDISSMSSLGESLHESN